MRLLPSSARLGQGCMSVAKEDPESRRAPVSSASCRHDEQARGAEADAFFWFLKSTTAHSLVADASELQT